MTRLAADPPYSSEADGRAHHQAGQEKCIMRAFPARFIAVHCSDSCHTGM